MSAKVRWSYQLPTYVVLIGLFAGMGCLRVWAARMGLTILGYIIRWHLLRFLLAYQKTGIPDAAGQIVI